MLKETPQLPFSQFKLVLEGGPRAVLRTPHVRVVKSEGDFTPWSEEPGVLSESTPSYTFEIDQNCSNGTQFNPSFKAGMPNVQAGAFSEFTLAFGRSDEDQYLSGISTTMPPGLLGSLTGVELCKEAQANAGTCGANSLIGTTEVLTGPGADPFLVSGGQVFLTEGYGGAPFGLSIVVPAVAGPYTLSGLNGNNVPGDGKVVVRAKIMINQVHGRVERHQQQAPDDARRHTVATTGGERADQPSKGSRSTRRAATKRRSRVRSRARKG